jgi:hypothetical protein
MAAEAKVTFKAGPGFEAPWVVLTGTVAEVGQAMAQLTQEGGWTDVKNVAKAFWDAATSAEAITNMQSVFPKAEVISDSAAPAAPAYQPTPAPAQGTPPCIHCGRPTTFHEGVGVNGPWSAYFCSSADKSHSQFIK